MTSTEWRPTACILCECNCGLEVQLGGDDDRHLIRFRGDKRHPSSRGYACEKPHRLDHYQHGRDRVTRPLRRRPDGGFDEIDWDTAIREVAARFAAVRDAHGGESIFYYGGGGQGNHLPGAYATATRRTLGSRYRSSALAQEKTGEFWVSTRMMGSATRADFEHCDVALFLGKNPWHSHSIARARVTLKELAQDPARTLVVIDPRRTETAAMADVHLAVRPGTDAWLMAAILAVIVEEDLVDHAFVAAHVVDAAPVLDALRAVPIAACCARSGVAEADVRRAARLLAGARALASFEDLGVQMNRGSTLVSYLHRLLIVLTGSLGRPGTHFVPTTLVDIANGASTKTSPVAEARIVGGLVPCNVIADEILTDHPARYRAMLVEAANPAHSLADSKRFREALRALDLLVVIDVAMSETAQLADYVLPAATQFEKAEATFFNFEFPANTFQLRPRLFAPPPGPLPEAEIHARLAEAWGAITEDDLAPLRAAAAEGLAAYAQAFMARVAMHPRLSAQAPVILYRTLALPEALREGAVVLGLAAKAALERPASLARAGFGGSPLEAAVALFTAIVEHPEGVVFAVDAWDGVLRDLPTPDHKIRAALPDLLDELAAVLAAPAEVVDPAFPMVLSAGERRSFTANTIIRDPAWRKKDAGGALRISPADAAALGVVDGDPVRLTTRRDAVVVAVEVTDTMQPGHLALPNGLGLGYPGPDGEITTGVAPNELTASDDRDRFVGTPWHKHVPARIERVDRTAPAPAPAPAG
ncbi:MAG: molybdopterin-dependent oxidoreductase [Kofleriaceae bacterium]|nr:molybdopterin-dependent oxidoreductase [Myxococcales bacterium]MCB9558884.1 molybdopterin-dependent oxidoreductase [Kofleriaceae bacterium]MCB9570559.1 molybdopterin-dependent oxidoreductase [Kofleriaceae bacterium]